jgi:AmmeMemoRadiSam system protein B
MRSTNYDKIREPAVAGQFYPSDAEELKKQIKQCFVSGFGPGSLPDKNKKKRIEGVIAPHAGYDFSGACAAWAYKEIAESEKPDTFVLLGLSHTSFPSCASMLDWKTPLGIAENDIEFSKKLEEKGIPVNEEAHAEEHSIEVQIPFLQFAAGNPKIVPIIAGHDKDYKETAKAIRETAAELKRKIIVIASSDFTHFGPAYGYEPFSDNVRENMRKLDSGAIEHIKKMDSAGFLDYVNKKQATICGQMPIAALIETINAKKAKLLKYYTSGDIVEDYTNSVGYASILFE